MADFITSFCDAANQHVMVKGKKVFFDFSYRFGPLLIDEDGVELKKQPMSENHPFWAPFNAWLEEFKKTNPPKPDRPRSHPSDHLDRRS